MRLDSSQTYSKSQNKLMNDGNKKTMKTCTCLG